MNPSDVYLKSARNREIPVYVLGCNADGSPIHSLARGTNRVPDDVTLQEWKL